MLISRKTAVLLVAAGLWPLLVWPNFVRVVATDERAFDGGPTAYLVVHVALAVVSMAFGAALVALGVRAWRRAAGPPREAAPQPPSGGASPTGAAAGR